MASIFVSPGVYTKEQDFTIFASRVGITRLGLVGTTAKGPAFEPIKITSTDEFLLRFGSMSEENPLTYVANSFLSQSNELSVTRVLGNNGFTNSPAWLIVASGSGSKSGSTLAVLRSKRNQISNQFEFTTESQVKIGAITTTLGTFILSASTGPLTGVTNSGYTVSLDETRADYIVNVLGQNPLVETDASNLYVERIYPHFIREAASRGEIVNISTQLVFANDSAHTDFGDDYKHSTTPWIVSRVIGGEVKNLFKVHTISDGDSSAREIKISIENIDVNNYTFDVVVRPFEDTDATASQSALERFSNVSLNENVSNFIGKLIGTSDESYPRKSSFISIEMAESYPINTVPAGFKGYTLRNSSLSAETSANIYYKTTYLSGDTVFKTYLGVSELGYTSFTQNQVSVRNSIKSLERDLFAYDGAVTTATTTVKGFHMENTADSAYFISGDKNSLTAYTNDAGTVLDRKKLKFTVAPFGGFDGWDKYRVYASPYERFEDYLTDNVEVFKDAVDTFANPEEVDINVFATPGIDFSNNETLVKYALDMIEGRNDSLYVIDAPRISTATVKGTADEIVSNLESTGIDSNYAATYWPWVQVEDPNTGKYSYQSPTFMVVQSLAFTDNSTAPWFAPAGINRGTASSFVKRADVKLSQSDRDVLYQGRINPIADFIQQGVVIFGQKTLQTQQSALDRINVRRLVLQVRRLVAAASLTLLFEQNDQTLRDQFLSKVEPLLLDIQNKRGITAFKVVMDESNNTPDVIDRNTLVGKIQLKPTRTAEFIDLTFQLVPTGASFNDF